MMNVLSYQHFPIYAIMLYFLGAFLIVLFGKNKIARHCLALLSVTGSLALLVSLVPRVMLGGEIITIGSDSHAPGQLGAGVVEAQRLLRELGFRWHCTFEAMQPTFHPLL